MRWFFEGALSAEPIVDWFTHRHDRAQHIEVEDWPRDWREDVYLVLPGQSDMGIKRRQEYLPDDTRRETVEFKGLTASIGLVQFSKNAAGKVERWVKWSYENDQVPLQLLGLFDVESADCVAIRKKRIQRRVRLDAFGNGEEVSLSTTIERGLNVELTRIEIGSKQFWTIGFEAFPHDADLHGAFVRNVGAFLNDFPESLEPSKSLSYPEWLNQLV